MNGWMKPRSGGYQSSTGKPKPPTPTSRGAASMHNPWSLTCVKRNAIDPADSDAICPLCDPPYPHKCPECAGHGLVQYTDKHVTCLGCRGSGVKRWPIAMGSVVRAGGRAWELVLNDSRTMPVWTSTRGESMSGPALMAAFDDWCVLYDARG